MSDVARLDMTPEEVILLQSCAVVGSTVVELNGVKYVNRDFMENVPPGNYIDPRRRLVIVHAGKFGTLSMSMDLPVEARVMLTRAFWGEMIAPSKTELIDPKAFLDVALPYLESTNPNPKPNA